MKLHAASLKRQELTMGSDYIPFALGPPLFGAFYTIPFELRMLILGVVIFVAIIWWVSKQGGDR